MQGEAVDDSWKDQAACHGEPREWFFPPDGRGTAVATWRDSVRPLAMGVCVECPVRIQCEEYAHANGEEAGVWGGVDFGVAQARQRSRARRFGDTRARAARLRAQGVSPRDIASALGVTRRTVHRHLQGSS